MGIILTKPTSQLEPFSEPARSLINGCKPTALFVIPKKKNKTHQKSQAQLDEKLRGGYLLEKQLNLYNLPIWIKHNIFTHDNHT